MGVHHTHSRFTHNQTPSKPHHINTQHKNCDDGSKIFLPQHANGTPRVHTNQVSRHTGGHYTALQITRTSGRQQTQLLLNWKRIVWTATSSNNCTGTPQGEIGHIRVIPKPAHTRVVEAWKPTNNLHTGGGWICNQILKEQGCSASNQRSKEGLCLLRQLGGRTVLQSSIQVGLQQSHSGSAFNNAKCSPKGTAKISPHQTNQAATPALPTCQGHLQSQGTIQGSASGITNTRQGWNKIHSRSDRSLPFHGTSHQWETTTSI